MNKTKRRIGRACVLTLGITAFGRGDVLDSHPNGKELAAIFARPLPADFKPTGVTRADYLKLIAGNVDFFKACQNDAGAIIDPVSKGERQYSTPAFAAAAGLLVKEAKRDDLKEPAARALTCALTALVEKRPADKHADFYIPLLVHAYRFIKDQVPAEQRDAWASLFKKIDPETTYRADLRGMNWNVVSSSGELLRRHDGLVDSAMADAQMAYLETCLAGHLKTLTPVGLFEDPGAPMAYDAFSRLWLEDVFADDAYDGKYKGRISTFLRTGGLSTLLMLSPTGEWPTGGRSALHSWTDAEAAAICEINAAYWQKQNKPEVAGAFKRAARLAFGSVARWQRPSGELNIIKNHAEPDKRLAYESYSNHSQYNLLPMAMLAIAYGRADESIAERPTPSEAGGYVFDVRGTFHKIFAAAGGYYVEIDTAGDPHYDATGLQRVQKAGVLRPAMNDTSAVDRAYGEKKGPKAALALGGLWAPVQTKEWVGLADFSGGEGKRTVSQSVLIKVNESSADRTAFQVTYNTAGNDARALTESYVLSSDGVTQTTEPTFSKPTDPMKVRVPVLVNDGAEQTNPQVGADTVTIRLGESVTTIRAENVVPTAGFAFVGPKVECHQGYVRAAVAGVSGGKTVVHVTMSQQ